jgi:uncharacterized membrane protein YphA (DoxX/SURF4 family)
MQQQVLLGDLIFKQSRDRIPYDCFQLCGPALQFHVTSTDIAEVNTDSAWTWWQRVLFRFAAFFWPYVCLFSPSVLLQVTTLGPWINRWILPWTVFTLQRWPESLETWFVTHIFHLTGISATRHPTSSGDTARDWIGILSLLVFAAIGAAIWTAISEWGIARRGWRKDYRTLYAWLLLVVRYTLASVLLSYGISKVFDLQFSPPDVQVLNERYGDSSPMRLLWTFVGSSVPYTIFSGVAEVVPGLLLLFRRTAVLGALIASAVMLNVVLLNFCYDVPVKLYSTVYLLMALFLLLPDMWSLFQFFVGRRDTRLRGAWLRYPERKSFRMACYCLQVLVFGHLIYLQVSSDAKEWKSRRTNVPVVKQEVKLRDPQLANIDGIWSVDDGAEWPMPEEWKTVTIGKLRYQSVDFLETLAANGSQHNFSVSMDLNHDIHFLEHPNSVLRWTLDSQDNATLEGTWLGQWAKLRMHRQEPHPGSNTGYPLMTRGFHWVQEYPYSR